MKRKYILLLLTAAVVCSACKRDEESLFSESAAQRIQTSLNNTQKALVSATNGWEMLYFPNPESAGYSVLLQFFADGHVRAASRNPQTTANIYKEDSRSTWDIKADYGPILTFDTYNNIIHAWADPQTDGDGYLGDYEFLILEANNDYIRLKGKKHEAYVTMFRLGDNQDWRAYFDEVYAQREMIVKRNDGTEFNYNVNGTAEKMTYKNGMMIVDQAKGIWYPFVVRPNGIRFERGIELGGVTTYDFVINEDMTKLVCTNNINASFTPDKTLVENLDAKLNNKVKWKVDGNDLGGAAKTAYNNMSNALKKQGGTLRAIYMLRTGKDIITDEDTTHILVNYVYIEFKHPKSGVKTGVYEMSYNYTGDVLSYQYVQACDDAEQMATYLLNVFGGGKDKTEQGVAMLKSLMCGIFTITSATGSLINPQQLYLTDTEDIDKRLKIVATD